MATRLKKQQRRQRRREQRKTVPAEFRIIEAEAESDFQLIEAADDGDGSEKKLRRFTMTAYTGGKLNLPNFPFPVVADLSGMRISAKARPILRDHSISQIVGHTETIDIGAGSIRLSGVISAANTYAREVAESSDNGFPWQASIGASANKVSFVDEGESVEVNGRRFTGPLYVARQSVLREISFVALGSDDQTSARLAAGDDQSTNSQEIGVTDMEFEQWLQAMGFDADELDDTQAAGLQALFESSQDDNGEDSPATAPAGSDNDPPPVAQAAEEPIQAVETAVEVDDPDPIAELRARQAAELRRQQRIGELCAGNHPEIEAKAIECGWDVTRTELELLRVTRPKAPAIHSDDGSNRSAASIEAALCMSAGLTEQQVAETYDERTMEAALSRDLRGAGIHLAMYEVIRAAGGHVRPGQIDNETIRAAFEANNRLIQASSGFSTLSLSGLLSNVANKTLLAAYSAVNSVVHEFCSTTDNVDFKKSTRYRMTGVGTFVKVGADGEIKHAELTEDTYSSQVETYGRMLALTRQTILNDDLSSFAALPRVLGRMAALALEEAVFTLLLSNPNNFFSAGNKNFLNGAGSALDIDALTSAEQKFLDQTDADGRPILIVPSVLLVPTSLKVTAEQLFKETQTVHVPAANKAKPASNPHAGKFRPITSPYLSLPSIAGNSTTAWYLFADPSDIAAIEIAYLRGQRTPVIEQGATDFNTLGMQFRAYHDFGVSEQETRAAVKSDGV